MAYIQTTFLTNALKRPITVHVLTPTDKIIRPHKYLPEKKPLKTIYLLEGLMGISSGPITFAGLQGMAEQYNVCIITVDSQNKWYANSKWTGDRYGDMVVNDLIKYTRNEFNLSHDREDTYIAGFSMGGYGALICGLRRPDLFSRMIIMNAALNIKNFVLNAPEEIPDYDFSCKRNYLTIFGLDKPEDFIDSENDPDYLMKKNMEEHKPEQKVFWSTGTLDALNPLNEEYWTKMKNLGYDVTIEWQENRGHSYDALRDGIRDALKWLPLDHFQDNIKNGDLDYDWTDDNNLGDWNTYYNV